MYNALTIRKSIQFFKMDQNAQSDLFCELCSLKIYQNKVFIYETHMAAVHGKEIIKKAKYQVKIINSDNQSNPLDGDEIPQL